MADGKERGEGKGGEGLSEEGGGGVKDGREKLPQALRGIGNPSPALQHVPVDDDVRQV